jgi:hypothetical protein
LSHTWKEEHEEVSFKDLTIGPRQTKPGFKKLRFCARQAELDNIEYFWVDTCCIEQSNSSELSEAINSMFRWYQGASKCYVYLSDLATMTDGQVKPPELWESEFRSSRWFTRGWTLQELIAPVYVEFYAEDWAPIGTKIERHKEIADITKIDLSVLVRTQEIDLFSAAEKLSWVAHRNVTREEDEAYSLLGLFEVNMPLLYGEGRERAFVRLQEAIYNSTADHTLFLFRHSLHHDDQPLLADSPTRFCDRIECTLCMSSGLQTVQLLPSDILYTNIMASERWKTQAHE